MRCIRACGLAPAMTINDKVYKQVNPDKLRSWISIDKEENMQVPNKIIKTIKAKPI